jgi:hypothetical protein
MKTLNQFCHKKYNYLAFFVIDNYVTWWPLIMIKKWIELMRLPRHFVPRNDEHEVPSPLMGEGEDEGDYFETHHTHHSLLTIFSG